MNNVAKKGTSNTLGSPHKAAKPVIEKKEIKIEPSEGILTIAELYKNSTLHENNIVKVKGQVTNMNPRIMDRNWIHLQDGTDYNGGFDLTVTTSTEIVDVKVGDIVTVEGKVSLDKDFGAGYKYKLILEEAVLVK